MVVTKVDEKGRILLPKNIRDKMNIKPGEEFLIFDNINKYSFLYDVLADYHPIASNLR